MGAVIRNNQSVPDHYSLLISTPFKPKALEWAAQADNPIIVTFNRGPWQNTAYVNIPQVDIASLDELRDLANTIRGASGKRTIIFDGLDDLQGILMTARLAEVRREEFGQSDWNWLVEQTKKIIQGFSNKGHDFVAICSLGQYNGATKVGLTGSSAWEIPRLMTYTLLYDQTTPQYEVVNGEPVIAVEGGSYYFRTGPSLQAPWITDYTEVLPLSFTGSIQELGQWFENFRQARYEVMNSQPEVQETAPASTGPVQSGATPTPVPGMSSDAEIAGMFGS